MKKRSIILIIGLMSVALLGMLGMQVYFMNETYTLKSELFNQSVNTALNAVSAKIAKRDAFNFLNEKQRDDEKRRLREFNLASSRNKFADTLYRRVLTPSSKATATRVFANADSTFGALSGIGLSGTQGSSTYIRLHGSSIDKKTLEAIKKLGNTTVSAAPARMTMGGAGMPKYNLKENPAEHYARLLQRDQLREDSLFDLRDSLLRKRYPIVQQRKIAIPDLIPFVRTDLRYEDELGVHQQSNTMAGRAAEIDAIDLPARKDSLASYVAVDPANGNVLNFNILKYRVSKISPKTLADDLNSQLEAASRASAYMVAQQQQNTNAVADLAREFTQVNIPFSQRIKPYLSKHGIHPSVLDSMLSAELRNQGITTAYHYQVSTAKKDSMVFDQISDKSSPLPQNTFQTRLFPADIIRDAGLLTITFPNKDDVIWSKMAATIGSSGALLLVVLCCFGFTVHSILRQKKISEMKTDFINNMTHEFKTPVATIMIASDALRDPEILEDQQRTMRLAGIIYDENVRLGNHIERVLNIAKIDKEDLKLEEKPVEMNDLIAAVTDSMSLQLQKKNVQLQLRLDADRQVVQGDELHLSNVIFNLVDNAVKYSKDQPQVTITTHNTGKNLVIRVADKGIGMSREYLTKIFDQFYRIPTGNLHDVKGFGLGLNYVSNVVRQLNGTVKAKSEKDKGSEFEITLPLA